MGIIGETIGFSETISIKELLVSERAKELDAEVLVELANSLEHDNRARFGTPNDFGNVFEYVEFDAYQKNTKPIMISTRKQ